MGEGIWGTISSKYLPKQYSLKYVLIFGFLLFTVIPLVAITIFTTNLSKQTLEEQLQRQLAEAQLRVVQQLTSTSDNLLSSLGRIQNDKTFVYYLASRSKANIYNQLKQQNFGESVDEVFVFERQGGLLLMLEKTNEGMQRNKEIENRDYALPDEFINAPQMQSGEVTSLTYFDFFQPDKMTLKTISNIVTEKGRLVGFVQVNYHLTQGRIVELKNKIGAEFAFASSSIGSLKSTVEIEQKILSTTGTINPSLFSTKATVFKEVQVDSKPFLFMAGRMSNAPFTSYFAAGISKSEMLASVKKINKALWFVLSLLGLVFVVAFWWLNKILIKPMDHLVDGINSLKAGEKNVQVGPVPANEIGAVMRNFNEMTQNIQQAQSQLVHQAKMASLGQLVAGVAHELNNPIGFIYANMKHLKDYTKSLFVIIDAAKKDSDKLEKIIEEEDYEFIKKDLPKLIQSCEEGSERTKDIVIGLRNFSRLNEAKLKKTNLKEDIENTLSLLSGELKNRVQVKKEYQEVPEILCHPSQINQVIMNVIANASHAISGEGKIGIKLYQKANSVVVEVSDSGKGMSDEVKSQVFDPFFTTKSVGEGTGLGLSISYGIIESHGGQIDVESTEGIGSKFTITLPINSESN